jgi:protein SCO1/2
MSKFLLLFLIPVTVYSCIQDNSALPILGQKIKTKDSTIYHTIRPFEFIDQDSALINNERLSDYIYVTDFFFTSCPSICPTVMKEMLKIYEEFENEPSVKLVSFTLDPKRDTPEKLKTYAKLLDVNTEKWIFVHGPKDEIYGLAEDFFVTAMEDEEAPGGVAHSGQIVLIDKKGHIRSFSNGTDASMTPRMINDIHKLIDEFK